MSDLKYKSVEQLLAEKESAEKRIGELQHQINCKQQRLHWINKYIFEKTPQELTVEEIERKLGHKIIIKEIGQ